MGMSRKYSMHELLESGDLEGIRLHPASLYGNSPAVSDQWSGGNPEEWLPISTPESGVSSYHIKLK
jgi:hypothetical protein